MPAILNDQNALKRWAPWVLAVAAVAAGYAAYGWPGVLLAITVIVFWLLLQFSRALRVMRQAANKPKGSVASAVMLHTKLRPGMRLAQVMQLTGSFGLPLTPPEAASSGNEAFLWRDESGASVELQMQEGQLSSWKLKREA